MLFKKIHMTLLKLSKLIRNFVIKGRLKKVHGGLQRDLVFLTFYHSTYFNKTQLNTINN